MKSSKEIISSTAPIIDSSSGKKEELLIEELFQKGQYKYLSKEFSSDLVKMYNQKDYTVDGLETEEQLWWYELLNKFNKTILKPFTNNNSRLNEIIMPKYMEALDKILYYADELKEEQDKKNKQQQQSSGGGGGQGSPEEGGSGDGQAKPEPKLDLKSLSKKPKQQETDEEGQPKLKGQDLEKFIKEQIEKADAEVEKEIQDSPEETLQGGKAAGDESNVVSTKAGLQKIQELQKKLRFNKEAINKIVKKTVDKFTNSFRTSASKEMIGFFDAEDLSDLYDLYNFALHPYFYRDVYTEEEKFGLTVDISVDISSSMNTSVNIGNEQTAFLPDICKYLVYSMAKNKILRDVSVFDYHVYEKTLDDFLNNDFRGGGTSIDNAILHSINKGDSPTIILTDGLDSVTHYSSSIYLLYVDESSFNNLKNNQTEAVKKFIQNKQVLGYFNGQFKEM